MRIIAGEFRRRQLLVNPGMTTRPITDRAKEILFERIQHRLEDSRVADIFSGTGSLGLEALSRGAASVVFIESDRQALELLKRNAQALRVEDRTLCWRTDAFKSSFRPKGVDAFLPYDVVFFDPPYRMLEGLEPTSLMSKSLERLARETVTAANAVLYVRSPEEAEVTLPACWRPVDRLPISSMTIHVFENGGGFQSAEPA